MTFSVTLLEVSELLLAVVKFSQFLLKLSQLLDFVSFYTIPLLSWRLFSESGLSHMNDLLITNHLQHIVTTSNGITLLT